MIGNKIVEKLERKEKKRRRRRRRRRKRNNKLLFLQYVFFSTATKYDAVASLLVHAEEWAMAYLKDDGLAFLLISVPINLTGIINPYVMRK